MRLLSRGLFVYVMLLPGVLLAAERFTVYTVNYPLQYFAERIGAEHIDVVFPAPPGIDPAFWKPGSDVLRNYRKADLVLLNGAGYAGWLEKVSLPRLKQVNTSAVFAAAYIENATGPTGNHAPTGNHSHAGTAFNTWLDFYQAVQQAETIKQALSKQLPAHAGDFERNYQALRSDLMQLDLDMQRTVASKPDQKFFASQSVYHYLARRYEMYIKDMFWKPDSMPDDGQWEQLRYSRENFLASWMLWEQRPVNTVEQKLQSMGIGIVVFDPCGNRPAQGDFLSVMRHNIEALKQVYTGRHSQANPREYSQLPN
jgi:zinc transport system substrate-binding protein